MTNHFQARQGDVLLCRLAAEPPNLGAPLARDKGAVVLAYGEVTGHAHRILDDNATLFEGGLRVIAGDGVTITPVAMLEPVDARTIRVQDAKGLVVRLPLADEAEVRAALAGNATVWREGSLLEHEEHDAVVLAPGFYELPGQREYVSADMPPLQVAD